MHPEILTSSLVINTPHIQRNAHFRGVITEAQNLLAGLKQKYFSSKVSSTLCKSTYTCLIQVMTHFPTVQEVFIKTAILH